MVGQVVLPDEERHDRGELLYGSRENKDGASGDDARVQFSAKFDF